MRRLLGMLRSDAADPLTPQPGLDDVPTLVAQLREAGLPVELRVEGERRELPVGIELSAYRIVQEALTNALKHAGEARATVDVRYGADSLELEIADDGAGRRASAHDGGGHGLVGMRERVALYGGRFDAARSSDGRLRRPRPPPDRMTTRPDRRRSGARARRAAQDPRERAGDAGRRRGGRRRGGGRARTPASARRRADGHPHARARRDRGDPAHRPRPAAARAC